MSEFASQQELNFALVKQGLTLQLSESENRCTDLIDELAQMNAELKRRGEKLAKVQEEVEAKVSLDNAIVRHLSMLL